MGLTVLIPLFSSCYNDDAIWQKFDEIEVRLDSLENQLNSQVEAMGSLLEDLTTISSCKKNTDGSYTVTLSNGTKFNVLPEGTDFSTLVTYTVVEGKKCWATYNANGELVTLKDASGNAIPVSTDVSVKIEDGVYVLVINGKEYETGYDAADVVQVFSKCTPLKDASGNVYAVKFIFGEGMETTVALDGYAGVIFRMANVNSNVVVSEYYIDYGTSASFLMDMQGVIDYVMQVPDGWRVKVTEDELTGETYINVAAPAAETVELGAAVAEGDLKVVSVVEGGKAAVSKMFVSTDPFKVYNVSSLKAVIEPYTGIQKFAYGMMLEEDFNKNQVVNTVTQILSTTSDIPEGYYVSERGIDLTLAEIFKNELDPEVGYVFWAIPALYREQTEDVEAGFYVDETMLRTLVLSPISVDIEVSNVTLLDAQINVAVKGTLSLYAGLTTVTETVLDEIVYQINNEIIDPIEVLTYEGLASAFPSAESSVQIDPETKYIVWIVPTEQDKSTYSANDMIYKEFTTKSVAPGGTLALTAGDFTATASSLSSNLSCEGAAMIYYAYLNDDAGTRYENASNEIKMTQIMGASTFASVRGTSAVASVKGLVPETSHWLFAVAVGHDGLYGDVICRKATTTEVAFNSISLSLENLGLKSNEAKFKVNVTEGTGTPTDYIYWYGYSNEVFWTSKNYCGNSRIEAQKYLAANPDCEQVVAAMKRCGKIAEDGTVTLDELSMNTEYVFIVLAKDETGKYSKAAYKKFTTLSANLGEIVQADTDKWKDALSKINIEWIEEAFAAPENSNMSAYYAFKFSCPTDLTAFVMCASENYFDDMGLKSIEEKIVYIEEYSSRKYDNGYVPYDKDGNMMCEPDYYKGGELTAGQLMNVYDYYVHGLPSLGFVTYFAQGDHDGKCIYWEDGKCSYYERALERIAYYNTIEPYREKAAQFGLKGDEAEAWAEDLLEAYKPFYETAKPIIYYNDASSIRISYPYASGVNDEGKVIDRVVVVLRDLQGNYYAPMTIEVPNHFE